MKRTSCLLQSRRLLQLLPVGGGCVQRKGVGRGRGVQLRVRPCLKPRCRVGGQQPRKIWLRLALLLLLGLGVHSHAGCAWCAVGASRAAAQRHRGPRLRGRAAQGAWSGPGGRWRPHRAAGAAGSREAQEPWPAAVLRLLLVQRRRQGLLPLLLLDESAHGGGGG